jgi:hypothetical protein
MNEETHSGQLRLKAYREAARAVAACALNIPFEFVPVGTGTVTACPTLTDGSNETRLLDEVGDSDLPRDVSGRQIERLAVVCFAGTAAHQQLTGRLYVDTHLGYAADLALAACESRDKVGEFLRLGWEQAKNLVALPSNWHAIEMLADTLLTHRTVSDRQARCIAQDVMLRETNTIIA